MESETRDVRVGSRIELAEERVVICGAAAGGDALSAHIETAPKPAKRVVANDPLGRSRSCILLTEPTRACVRRSRPARRRSMGAGPDRHPSCCASVRLLDGVDDVDDAVRLHDVGDGDARGAALRIIDGEVLVADALQVNGSPLTVFNSALPPILSTMSHRSCAVSVPGRRGRSGCWSACPCSPASAASGRCRRGASRRRGWSARRR